jgi:hypothetical protein
MPLGPDGQILFIQSLRCAKENSPPLQRWVLVQEDKSSPDRDESPVVPDGTCMACLAGRPSHKWLSYSREISAI